MGVVAGLTFIVGLIFLLAGCVGFIAPSLFEDKKTGEIPKRLHLLLGGVFAAVVLFVAGAALAPDNDTKISETKEPETKVATKAMEEPKEAPAVVKAPEPKPVKSLGVTPEEFRKAFNDSVVKIDADYKLAEFDIEKGEVNDVFKRSIGKNMGLVGAVSKQDGRLIELTIMIGGGDAKDDTLHTMVALLAAVQALNPTAEKNGDVVAEMLKQAVARIENPEPVEREVGAFKYTALASKVTGLMFVVSPK